MEGCIVTDLKVHSQRNCYRLSPEQMQAIQNQGVSVHLEPGTWASLNGFDDALVMDVVEPATLCAFFFDTEITDNEGELTLSVVRI